MHHSSKQHARLPLHYLLAKPICITQTRAPQQSCLHQPVHHILVHPGTKTVAVPAASSPSQWLPMEALYSALEGEISTFVKHVQQCQESFDLCSQYHMLLLMLPGSSLGQVESKQSPDMARYICWLVSYLQHLSMLKERFDARVVVPLCENLYMHEEPAVHPTWQAPPAPIPRLAAQLFAHRRNWGLLLLQGKALSEQVNSPQSLHDLHGFTGMGPFVKVLQLVLDVFYQTLATAEFAQRWVHLHHSKYSLSLPPSPSPPPWGSQQPYSPSTCPDLLIPLLASGAESSARVLRARLQESQEELLALLSRRQRAAALHAQVCHLRQCIRDLRLQQQGEGTELAQPQQSLGVGTGDHCYQAAQAEELQKSLELKEYHHSILEADWLLELEVRPILIRRIDVVQQRCWDLERMLQGQTLPVPQWVQLRGGMATTSATYPTAATSPRNSQQT